MKQKRTPSDYALWAALPMAHTSQIEGRLTMILDQTRRRTLPRRFLVLAGAAGAAALVPLAMLQPGAKAQTLTPKPPLSQAMTHMSAAQTFPRELDTLRSVNIAAEVSGLTGKNLVAFNANMDEVQVYDKQNIGQKDVSAEEAKRMTTKELITQTNRLKLIGLAMLYDDDPNIGLYRASRCSNSMAELLGRKDFTAAFLQAYSSFDPNPKTNPHFEEEGGLFGTDWMLLLQNYPSLRDQSAGHEKEILSALCKKCRETQKVNASYPKGQAPYGPTSFALGVAQRFAKKVFPKARILSAHSMKDGEPGVQELEQLCGS